jgi:ArsR family transcriptional regulator
MFKALGDKTRISILDFLMDGEKSVCIIAKHIQKAQPTTSIHLAKLEDSGIVSSRKEGKTVYYSISSDKIFKIQKIFDEETTIY